ncbi:MAG: O-antigen ligase family protein [Pseudomonadota bacterium]
MSSAGVEDYRLGAFLLLALALGGTAQYDLSLKPYLYLLALGFIAWGLMRRTKPFATLMTPALWIGAALFGLFVFYLVPLPPSIWTSLEGRAVIREGFALVDADLPAMPLSLAPERTLMSLFAFIPPICVAVIMRLAASRRELRIADMAVVAAALVSFLIGLLDVFMGLRLVTAYDIFNDGFPTGFFSNVNHQATLVIAAIPFAAYFVMRHRSNGRKPDQTRFALALCALILLAAGTLTLRSGAGYGMLAFALVACAVTAFRGRTRRVAVLIAAAASVVLAGLVLALPGNVAVFEELMVQSRTARPEIYATTLRMRPDFGLFGIGPGAFEYVYKLYETRGPISNSFVNETHNDYLQIWTEFGVAGLVWLAALLGWFVVHGIRALRSDRRLAGLVAISLACIFIHSAVDYPMRTIGIATLATYLALRLESLLARDRT